MKGALWKMATSLMKPVKAFVAVLKIFDQQKVALIAQLLLRRSLQKALCICWFVALLVVTIRYELLHA